MPGIRGGGSAAQMKWGWRQSSDTAERALKGLCVSFRWAAGSDAAVWINSQAAHICERLGRYGGAIDICAPEGERLLHLRASLSIAPRRVRPESPASEFGATAN